MKRKDSPFSRSTTHGLRDAGHGLRELEHKEPEKRRPGHAVYHSRRWLDLSNKIRRKRGCCETCGATDQLSVDHRVPLFALGEHPELHPLAWAEQNLSVLCPPCHATKDQEVRQAYSDQSFRDDLASKLDWLDEGE